MIATSRREAIMWGSSAAAMATIPSPGWSIEPGLDRMVTQTMAAFAIPGAAFAIIRPGVPPFVAAYGKRRLDSLEPVDRDTLFAIASNSKSFTGAMFAMLVDQGKISWEDPVIRYLPEFAMSDPVVTEMMTVRDLLVHRSGLALGAGDLMIFPTSNRTALELLHGLKYLPLKRGFRSGYAYDNVLYIVAGLLLERLTGKTWGENIRERIFRPLGMRTALPFRDPNERNVAGRHARLGPPVRGFGPQQVISPVESSLVAPAGGIQASVTDIARWLQLQLGRGQTPGGTRLWSEAQAFELWTPQVITASGPGPSPEEPARSVMTGYATGWFVQQYRDRRLIAHSGGVSGQITHTALLPEEGIAVAVFTNAEEGGGALALRNTLLDHMLSAPPVDWIGWANRRGALNEKEVREALGSGALATPAGGPSLPLDAYSGRYRDPWYGDIVIESDGHRLEIDFTRSPSLKSELEPFGRDAFRTRFPRGAAEDAVISLVVSGGRVKSMTMKALSPLADFSYDFQDLHLERLN